MTRAAGGFRRSTGRIPASGADPLDRTYHRDKDGKFSSGDGSGGGSEDPSQQLHDDESTIHAVFNFHDSKTGITAQVERVGTDLSGAATLVGVKFHDADGGEVGHATRFVHPEGDRETVDHALFELNPGVRGQGFAARWAEHVEVGYRAHGVTRIILHANIDVGGYAWARAGYNFHDAVDRKTVGSRAKRMARNFDSQTQDEIRRVASNPHSTPADFAMIGHTPGATMWPGKRIMLKSSWVGVRSL